jgi:uncharacterized protein (DUF1810 family)
VAATGTGDSFDLERFVAIQRETYASALAEIRAGRKRSHWIWYIFPQAAGLGQSAMSVRYAIGSTAEAQAYLDHALLGARYRECVAALQALGGHDPEAVFGAIDAVKLRSSLTLFAEVSGEPLFTAALDKWFGGQRDAATLAILSGHRPG